MKRKLFKTYLLGVLLLIMTLPLQATKIAIFVNGNMDCCTSNMTKTKEAFLKLGIIVYDTPWNSLSMISGNNSENQSPKATVGATQNFINHMKKYISELPPGSELYLIGHSFGGDSILEFLDQYKRTDVKFKLVAVLDAVASGGRRSNSHRVSQNVEYFFNRWQTNFPWPVDIGSSGRVVCDAGTCNQQEQSISKHPNGNARKSACKKYENCPGAEVRWRGLESYYYPGEKQTRLHHQYVPTDPYIEKQIIDIVTNANTSTFVKHGNNGTVSCDTFCSSSQWGGDKVGTCVSAFNRQTNKKTSCSSIPGLLNGLELTCNCYNNAIVRYGNNGTINCKSFCSRTSESCISAFDTKHNRTISCNKVPGFLNGKHLKCSCN